MRGKRGGDMRVGRFWRLELSDGCRNGLHDVGLHRRDRALATHRQRESRGECRAGKCLVDILATDAAVEPSASISTAYQRGKLCR